MQEMSLRTPETPSWLNNADNIERCLKEDGDRVWGFVIHRCTYKGEADWQTFMARFRHRIEESLKAYNGLDMMEHLGTAIIREHFTQWTANALEHQQGEATIESVSKVQGRSQRYRYCILMDEGSLDSVLEDMLHPIERDDAFVVLVWKDWVSADDSQSPEVEEPLEGCTLQDVGWMMVAYEEVMVEMYYRLRDYNAWYIEYSRPLEIAHG